MSGVVLCGLSKSSAEPIAAGFRGVFGRGGLARPAKHFKINRFMADAVEALGQNVEQADVTLGGKASTLR
jgi:hypothetical protein